MKRIALATLFAAALMAFGTIRTVTSAPHSVLDNQAVTKQPVKAVRFDDDPPTAQCPPLPAEFCGGEKGSGDPINQ